ncbi:hypothetical protein PG5_01410 [Pseudomonas sp. G5(2012)]|nr:hypothetical protein PG5_01410 [Pseudomonas sp. G5(2012)]
MYGFASFMRDEEALFTLSSKANDANTSHVYIDVESYQGVPKNAAVVEVPPAREMLRPRL